MRIKKIILENIRSYEREEIEFPEGSTLLSGDIGCGKTSVLLAVEFALFGLQPGQKGTFLLKNGKEEGKVEMHFEVEGNQIIVERTLKRGKSVSQDYAALTINGEKKEMAVTELKSRILDILSYPKEFSKKQNILYKFTVYTPQEEMKQIILQDASTRVNTLRHIFGIDKYKKILENISVVTLKMREEKRVKEALVSNLEEDRLLVVSKDEEVDRMKIELGTLKMICIEKTNIRKKIEEENKELVQKIEEKNNYSRERDKTKIMVSSKKESFNSNKRILENLIKEIEEFQKLNFEESKLQILEEEILQIKKEKDKFDSKRLEIAGEISALNSKNDEAEKIHKKMSNLEVCPTCLQNVDSIYRSNVLNKAHNDMAKNKKRLEELSLEREEASKKIKELELNISVKQKELTDLKILKMKLETVKEKRLRLEEINSSNQALEKDIYFLEKQIENLNDLILSFSKYEKQYEIKKKELDEALRGERMAEIKVAELNKEVEMLLKHIVELKERIKKTEDIKFQLNYISELESWLSKKFSPLIAYVEKNVMIAVRNEFSALFKEWFSMLVSESFNVRLDEDFTPVIEQQDYELDYSYLSGGERTAIALAYRLALNQVINSLMSRIKTRDLVILDEPTDGFSDQQLDKMREVLDELNVGQLIIVSHEQKIEGFVENVIKFKKENGISHKI
jgi:DNA repair protein SbcC/Rad50